MNFTKKANDFGVFSNLLVVNNDLFESVNATKAETKEGAIRAAACITSTAISDKVKKGELNPIEGFLAGIGASDSTNITLVTPDIKDIKLLIEAVIKTAEDGNMCHMKDYVHETGNNIPREIWDYIYKLTNDKQSQNMTLLNIICGAIPIIILVLKSRE